VKQIITNTDQKLKSLFLKSNDNFLYLITVNKNVTKPIQRLTIAISLLIVLNIKPDNTAETTDAEIPDI
jgi:hypothetical protein